MNQILRVLFIEDNPDDYELMAMALAETNGYDLYHERVETEKGFRNALHNSQWDIIICDYGLPLFDFNDVIKVLVEFGLDIIFILVSGQITQEQAQRTLKYKQIHDFMDKRDMWRLSAVIHRAMDLYNAYDSMFYTFTELMNDNNTETKEHTERVIDLSVALARRLGVSESKLIHVKRGALLHDIGKIGISDLIVKKQGPLSIEEWEIMRQHPIKGYNSLIKNIKDIENSYLKYALDVVLYHHENWDGTGYPRGLKGELIPEYARAFKIVDVYDALTNDRVYKTAWGKEEALDFIGEMAGILFDGRMVRVFLEMMK